MSQTYWVFQLSTLPHPRLKDAYHSRFAYRGSLKVASSVCLCQASQPGTGRCMRNFTHINRFDSVQPGRIEQSRFQLIRSVMPCMQLVHCAQLSSSRLHGLLVSRACDSGTHCIACLAFIAWLQLLRNIEDRLRVEDEPGARSDQLADISVDQIREWPA